ncbi:hypothetical protein, partial [Endozoicomonas sp. ONNA2]|uniref:hypothetical protein n=1 Tax=Endozoicomonas sp. ONNA2 TaxID=2828741 RepID=UPI002147B6E7
MEPTAQSYLGGSQSNAATSNLAKDHQALNNSLEPISRLVANFNKSWEVSESDQTQPFKRMKLDLPPGWMATTDIGDRKLVGLHFSTNHDLPDVRKADASQPYQPDIEMIPCDSRVEPDPVAPAKRDIFQCRANCLEFILQDSFDCYIMHASFSPTGKNLLINGCDTLREHSLITWRQDEDGNW